MPSNTSDPTLSSTPTLSSRSLRSLSSRTGSVRDPQRRDSKLDGWLSLPDGLRTVHVRNDTGECPARNDTGECPVRNDTGECPVRLPDWEGRLIEWLGKASEQRFVWGEFDCALAAADALTAQTGQDFAKPWRGTYRTDKGALKALLRRGYRNCWEAMADALGTDSVPASLLSRGDIGAVNAAGMKTLGVIWAGSIWLPEPHGLMPHSIKLVSHGWQLDSPLSLRTKHSPLSLRTGIVRNPSGRDSQPSGLLSLRCGSRTVPVRDDRERSKRDDREGGERDDRVRGLRDDRVRGLRDDRRDDNNKEKGVTICPR